MVVLELTAGFCFESDIDEHLSRLGLEEHGIAEHFEGVSRGRARGVVECMLCECLDTLIESVRHRNMSLKCDYTFLVKMGSEPLGSRPNTFSSSRAVSRSQAIIFS